MAVEAIELKPRGVVALYDAALRLCARTSGLWALTLPAGALLLWAVFALAEALRRHHDTTLPVIAVVGAWLVRAVAMGAASHHAEALLLAESEPTTFGSLRAALNRAPSLIITTTFCLAFNALLLVCTAGLGFIFFGAHAAAYAVTMRGQGAALAVYQTSAKLLGPTRQTGAVIRVTAVVQLLAFFNLHVAMQVVLYLAKNLLALNLSFVDRFASFDNPVWVAVLAATTFVLFDPVRAAVGALLLVDGRVRQEGLDLKAAVEQLPARARRVAGVVAGALVLLLSGTALATEQGGDWSGVYVPGAGEAPEATSAMRGRLEALIAECELEDPALAARLAKVDRLAERQSAALSRFVSRMERLLDQGDDDGCRTLEATLGPGLALMEETDPAAVTESEAARKAAAAILARPEFEVVTDTPKEKDAPEPEEGPGWFSRWWDDLWKAIARWFKGLKGPDAPDVPLSVPSGGIGLSNLIIPLAIALVLALIVVLVARLRGERDDGAPDDAGGAPGVQALEADPMSALTRPPETWAGLADELAARGEYREAIRHLYLALLSRLHRDGAIDYDPAKSNWDYLRAFKGTTSTKGPFRDLTRRFDFAWYGRLETDPESWKAFRRITEPLLVSVATEATAGA